MPYQTDDMRHTYRLTQHPYVDPFLVRGVLDETVTVTEPRTLMVRNSKLELLEEEPDLPVGEEVRVWYDRWFRCQAVKDQQAEAQDKAQAEAEVQQSDDQARQHAEMAYLRSAEYLVATDYPMSKARHFLETYWKAQEHFTEQHRFCSNFDEPLMKRDARHATITLSVLDQALSMIYQDMMERLSARYNVKAVSAYAYSPKEGGQNGHHSPGNVHVMLRQGVLRLGHLKRQEGDALCKPHKRFWGLTAQAGMPSCRSCVERMLTLLEKCEQPG